MRIHQKLILGFLGISLLLGVGMFISIHLTQKELQKSIGENVLHLTRRTMNGIDKEIYIRIGEMQEKAKESLPTKVAYASNEEFDKIPDVQNFISTIDRDWRDKKDIPFIKSVLNNELSKVFIKHLEFLKRKYGYAVFTEMYITNKYGVVIASTGRTSDYLQADEEWYQKAVVEKEFWVGDVEYDESSETYSIDIVVNLYDENGKFAGIIKGVLNLEDIKNTINLLKSQSQYKSMMPHLVNKNGFIIFSGLESSQKKLGKDIKLKEYGKDISTRISVVQAIKGNEGYIIGTEKEELLVSFSHSKGFKNYKGLGWSLIIDFKANEVFNPVTKLSYISAVVLISTIIIAVLIGVFISRSIAKPIAKLTKGAEAVGEGDLKHRVDIKTKDEIAELAATFNQMVEKRQQSEEFLENIFKTSADGIVITNSQGIITMTNEAVEKILGYSQNDLVGKYSDELGPKGIDYKERGKELQKRLFKEGTVTGVEHSWVKKDGSIIEIEMNIALLKDARGNPTGVVAGIRDITERKEMEETLKRSEEKYCSLIENANDAIISSSKEGLIVGFNKKAEEMFGYTSEEVLGKSVLMLLPQNNKEINEEIIEEVKTTNRASTIGQTLEAAGLRKDGQIILAEASYYSYEVKGEYFITAVIRDITERKAMEEKLLQSEKLKSLGELAGGVAHDFNNVLAAILGRAQLLRMIFEPPPRKEERRKSMIELKEGLRTIEQASRDGAETVRRIQEFSRRRDDDRHFTTIDLNEIIDNALEFTKVRWKNDAESKGIKINVQKELSILPTISGSASELREVFTNIINNAIDAMPQGGSIRIKTFKEDSHIAIKVEDTGIGIPKAIRDRIFDPFFTTKGVQSTGLGMSVSYGIINRHRGTITLDSIEGQGTAFTIKLPISEKAVEAEQVKPFLAEQRKASILVIEDEEPVRNLLSAILIKGGHEVKSVTSGSQGIEVFEKKEFDLVFTDLGMPGMSGWQVAEKVKSINTKIPVALITGWNVELKESEMKKSGVDLIVYKPFEVNQVLKLVQEGMILKDRFKAA